MLRVLSTLLVIFAAMATQAGGAKPIAFVGVNIIPMDHPRVLTDQTLIVENGIITALGDRDRMRIDKGMQVVQGKGGYLLPGLSDMHVHIGKEQLPDGSYDRAVAESELLLFLATGVTTIRNMAGNPSHAVLADALARGEIVGPRLYTASPILEGADNVWDFAIRVVKPEDAEPVVADLVAQGYPAIKVYHTLSPEVYQAVVAAARRHDVPVVGHVPFASGIDAALDAHQYSIEHLRGYDSDGVARDALYRNGGRNAERFSSWQRMSEQRRRELVAQTVAAGVWNCPTLTVYELLYDSEKREAIAADPLMRYVHPKIRERVVNHIFDELFSEESKQAMRASLPRQYAFVKALSDAGAKLLVGTDAMVPYLIHGYTSIDEIQHFVNAGITPFNALQAATAGVAEFLGESSRRGTIAVGKQADFILLEKNPLDDVQNLWQQTGVAVAGRWYDKTDLRRLLDALASGYGGEK